MQGRHVVVPGGHARVGAGPPIRPAPRLAGTVIGRSLKRALGGAAAGVGPLLLMTSVAGAQDAPRHRRRQRRGRDHRGSLNLLWVVIGAVLVIFMQAGFALVETGFCRAKHAAHVVSTNFAIFGWASTAFFVCGFAFAFSNCSFASIGLTESVQSPCTSGLIGSGNWVFLWGKAGLLPLGHQPEPCSPPRQPSSSTWWPSWTPRPRSRRGRWRSGGSGRASSCGVCSAARSTTRCSPA